MTSFFCADASMPDDFAVALDRVCQAIDWDYGEVWIPVSETELLELSPAWYAHQNRSSDRLEDLRKFRICSEKFVLSIGEGLPGKIWYSRQPEWVNDVSIQSESYFLRNQIAKAFNVRAGFGFPVFCSQAIAAVFVFFTDHTCEEDFNLIQQAIAAASLQGHQALAVF